MSSAAQSPDQFLMDYAAPRQAAKASKRHVAAISSILARAEAHMTAEEICQKLGWLVTENNKRRIRAVSRAAFPEILSFVGGEDRPAGYKVFSKCTNDELWLAVGAIEADVRDGVVKKKALLDEIYRRGARK